MALTVKEFACQCRRQKDVGSASGLGRLPGEGNGNPLQYSCLENSMDRGAWRAAVHGVPVRQDWAHTQSMHACTKTKDVGPQSRGSLSEVSVSGFTAKALKNQEGSQGMGETLINTWTLFCVGGLDPFKIFRNGQTGMDNLGPSFLISFSYFDWSDLDNEKCFFMLSNITSLTQV